MNTSNGTQRSPYSKVCITLPDDQRDAIDAWADERRTNRSAMVREALDAYLRLHGRDPRLQPRTSLMREEAAS